MVQKCREELCGPAKLFFHWVTPAELNDTDDTMLCLLHLWNRFFLCIFAAQLGENDLLSGNWGWVEFLKAFLLLPAGESCAGKVCLNCFLGLLVLGRDRRCRCLGAFWIPGSVTLQETYIRSLYWITEIRWITSLSNIDVSSALCTGGLKGGETSKKTPVLMICSTAW